MVLLWQLLLVVTARAVAPVTVDLLIFGGGIACLSTARAAAEGLDNLSTVVLESGTICGQGVTAAAKQGHVYCDDTITPATAGTDSERWRLESLHIYTRMQRAGFDLDFRPVGSVAVVTDLEVPLRTLWSSLQHRLIQTVGRLVGRMPTILGPQELAAKNVFASLACSLCSPAKECSLRSSVRFARVFASLECSLWTYP
jgi:glycine/D-amino acid oxidase-like deaminating enzyme